MTDVFSMPPFLPGHRGGCRECADKLVSEAAEAFAEIRRAGDEPSPESRRAAALEIADVVQTCRNACDACGIGAAELADAMRAVAASNRRRGRVAEEQADSVERLELDVEKGICEYFGREFVTDSPCEGCPADGGEACSTVMLRDVARRVRAILEAGARG